MNAAIKIVSKHCRYLSQEDISKLTEIFNLQNQYVTEFIEKEGMEVLTIDMAFYFLDQFNRRIEKEKTNEITLLSIIKICIACMLTASKLSNELAVSAKDYVPLINLAYRLIEGEFGKKNKLEITSSEVNDFLNKIKNFEDKCAMAITLEYHHLHALDFNVIPSSEQIVALLNAYCSAEELQEVYDQLTSTTTLTSPKSQVNYVRNTYQDADLYLKKLEVPKLIRSLGKNAEQIKEVEMREYYFDRLEAEEKAEASVLLLSKKTLIPLHSSFKLFFKKLNKDIKDFKKPTTPPPKKPAKYSFRRSNSTQFQTSKDLWANVDSIEAPPPLKIRKKKQAGGNKKHCSIC